MGNRKLMGREKAIIDLKEFTNWLESNEEEWPKTISRHNLSNISQLRR